jgi:hypothetical protein
MTSKAVAFLLADLSERPVDDVRHIALSPVPIPAGGHVGQLAGPPVSW